MIRAKKLVKTFYKGKIEIPVLRGIDLEIKKGEFVGIVGRSGAGKSTLLYQLALLDHPTSGEVTLNGTDTANLSSAQRTRYRLKNLGFVFQNFELIPELTAAENVMVPLIMLGYSKRKAFEKASVVLTEVGLGERLYNLPGQLSGGEQQRVGVSRAFVHEPDIIFADEPTASLDSVSAKAIMEMFGGLHKKGQTIVMVTHESENMKYVNRVITISDGKVIGHTSKIAGLKKKSPRTRKKITRKKAQ